MGQGSNKIDHLFAIFRGFRIAAQSHGIKIYPTSNRKREYALSGVLVESEVGAIHLKLRSAGLSGGTRLGTTNPDERVRLSYRLLSRVAPCSGVAE